MKRKFDEQLRDELKLKLKNAGYRSDDGSDTDSENEVKQPFLF